MPNPSNYSTFEEFQAAYIEHNKELFESELGKNGQFDELPYSLWYKD